MRGHKEIMILKFIDPSKVIVCYLCFCGMVQTSVGQSSSQVIDKIVAKVDNYIILKSEVEQTYLDLISRGQTESANLRCAIIENLIANKLMVAIAEIDSVEVTEEEVESNLDRRFQIIVSQIGSVEEIERYYGKSVQEFREELRPSVKEQLIVQRMEDEITRDVTVTPSEVKRFFKKIPRDSLPYYSKEVNVAQIVKYPDISKGQKQKIIRQLNDLRDQILEGGDFEALARKYSEDPGSASRGGNYGFQKRGQFVPEYEAAVFTMKKGEISEPIESDFGFHLIQLLERRGNEYNSRHILIRALPSEEDLVRAEKYLDSLRTIILADSITFEKAAADYSDDLETSGSGGYFLNHSGGQSVPMDEIDPLIFFVLDTMETNRIIKPIRFRTQDGKDAIRILFYESSTRPHVANLNDDYQKIYAATLNEKRGRALNDWFHDAKKDVFIDIDSEFNGCQILQ